MLVLAMLSLIAEDKQNVIFGMEEPETAIPPYAQKRIVQEIRRLASQAIFTSHSPYVLEEFALDETVVLSRASSGCLVQMEVELPDSVKLKRYRQEFRTRFCEGLLASRILVAEGATEATSLPAAARRLAELDAAKYASLEALGICTVDAGGEGNIADIAAMYASLGKRVFAACDNQSPESRAEIEAKVETLFMHDESSLEKLVLKNSANDALDRFSKLIAWPTHITEKVHIDTDLPEALRLYFNWAKGNWGVADFLAQCNQDEMPEWVRQTCASLRELCENASVEAHESREDEEGVEESSADDEDD
jgi:putative ATP-dependent endonuclease of OLD family